VRITFEDIGSFRAMQEAEALHRIALLVGDGWHAIAHPDPDTVPEAAYFTAYSADFELMQKSYLNENAYGPHGDTLTVVASGGADDAATNKYTVDRALTYLRQRVRVLVENQINDGRMFERLLTTIDADLVKKFHDDYPSVEWAHAGGKDEMEHLVANEVANAKARRIRPRLPVVCDSDSKFPGHQNGSTNRLRRVCTKATVGLFVLRKRSIENYLHDRVLSAYALFAPDVRAAVSSIRSLTAEQRDHYPIKNGFRASLSPEEVVLYKGAQFLAKLSRSTIMRMWLMGVIRRLARRDSKAHVPSSLRQAPKLPGLFAYYIGLDSLKPNMDDLRERKCEAEVIELARTIRSLL